MRVEPVSIAASDQVLATLQFARTLPYVDASRWVAMGQSVGGLTTVAVAWRNPAGLVGAINFAGGAGGDPQQRPGQPCMPGRSSGCGAPTPARRRCRCCGCTGTTTSTGAPTCRSVGIRRSPKAVARPSCTRLAAAGGDGHNGLNIDMNTWVPLVEAYLARIGFSNSGVIARPAATAHARIDDVAKVPTSQNNRDGAYKRFLEAKLPRAFAIGPKGAAGWATGDWALGRALGFCQRRNGERCKLYAVDDDVVWGSEP